MTQRKSQSEKIRENDIFISRLVDAPRELVFKIWTDPKKLPLWFAPKGCTIHFTKLDIRPGGSFHSCIKNPAHNDCWCMGAYLEIVASERIVFEMAVADEMGNLVNPSEVGMDPDWPGKTKVTVTFAEEGNKTRFTLHQTVSETLAKRTGAYPGWLSMLDNLDELLTTKANSY